MNERSLQRILSSELSRRDVLKLGVISGEILLLTACGITDKKTPPTTKEPTPKPEMYEGPLVDMRGFELMSNSRFDTLTKALSETGDPLFSKISDTVSSLHYSETNPVEFNELVSEESTPLPVAQDQTHTSHAYLFSDREPEPGFMLSINGELHEWKYLQPAILGIKIGANPRIREGDPLNEALFLAKEQLSLMLILRIAQELPQHLPEGAQLLEIDGSPITDPLRLKKAGLAIFMNSAEGSQIWNLADTVPVMLMAPSMKRLITSGRLPASTNVLAPFYDVLNVTDEINEADEITTGIAVDYTDSSNYIPSEGLFGKLLDPKIEEAVNEIRRRIQKYN